ncbi:MAG: HAD hydrolase family protein [Nitrososphaeria archaeon]
MLVFASDYDRTLTDQNLQPCYKVINYISSFRPEIFFIVASGRRLEFLLENLEPFADAFVAENGAVVYHEKRKYVFGKEWNERVRKIIDEKEGIWFGEVLLYSLLSREGEIRDALAGKINYRIERNKESIMVMPEYINKNFGVLNVLRSLGSENLTLAAIGDDYNDISIIEASDIKLALQNSIPQIKAFSDFVSVQPYCEGTLEAFEYLLQKLKILGNRF